jgi:ATP-dependent RNA helicase SUPV3L1/SUV3
MGARIAGFRSFGEQMLRIDMAERMARTAHEAIAKNEGFTAQSPQIVSLGLSEDAFLQLMRLAGFRAVEAPEEGGPNWVFRGRQKPRPQQHQRGGQRTDQGREASSQDRGRGKPHGRQSRDQGEGKPRGDRAPRPATASSHAPASSNAFAGLAELLGRNG